MPKAPQTTFCHFWHCFTVEVSPLEVGELAEYLEEKDLFVIFPKRMTSREEKQVERRNEEFFALYQRLREEGMKREVAIKTAAEMEG